MFIITNTCYDGEYTPSKANTLKEAREWLQRCTVDNLVAWKADKIEEYWSKEIDEVTDDEVIEWAEDELEDFIFNEDESRIYYDDDSYNIMNIYDLDKI